MFNRSKPEVLVVGAGPVGLFAALSLAKRGIRVEIIDEEWRSTMHSYALALHPDSLELLDELGLASRVLERARRVSTVGLFDGPERRAELDLSALPSKFPFLAILSQADLENLLVDELKRQNIAVEWNTRLAEVSWHKDSVTTTIHKLDKEPVGYAVAHMETVIAKSRDMDVPFVLGADGHDSLVRKQLGIGFDSVRPAQHFAVFEFEANGELPDEVCVVLDEQTSNVLWPMPDSCYRWSFQIADGVAPGDSRDKDRLVLQVGRMHFPQLEREYLDQLLAQRAPWFRGSVSEPYWRMAVRFDYRLAAGFGKARVWLAGDAGHMTGPVGAQSMNVGLREAAELADIFTGVLQGKRSLDALVAYNASRLAEWRTLLGIDTGYTAARGADPWIAQRADRLIRAIPASGERLAALAAQVGLVPNPG